MDNIAELSNLPEKKKDLERNYGSSKISTNKHKNWTVFKSAMRLVFFASSYSLSGMVLLTNFPEKLYESDLPYRPLVATSLALVSNLIGSIVSSFMTNLISIRITLVLSSILMSFCMGAMGVFHSNDDISCDENSYQCYIPLVIVLAFFVSLSIGIGTIFVVIIGEKLPLKRRALTVPFIMVTMEVCEAFQIFFLPKLIEHFDEDGLLGGFITFAAVNFLSAILSFFWLD